MFDFQTVKAATFRPLRGAQLMSRSRKKKKQEEEKQQMNKI